jgi:hypothetical protein
VAAHGAGFVADTSVERGMTALDRLSMTRKLVAETATPGAGAAFPQGEEHEL